MSLLVRVCLLRERRPGPRPASPLQHARRYAEVIPGAQLRIYPGHDRFSILSAPREILAAFAG